VRPAGRSPGGAANDCPLRVIDDGIEWEILRGHAPTRDRATVRDDRWRETGERLVAGQPPQRLFERSLRRIGASVRPAAALGPGCAEPDFRQDGPKPRPRSH
jgi:hypothetical protein